MLPGGHLLLAWAPGRCGSRGMLVYDLLGVSRADHGRKTCRCDLEGIRVGLPMLPMPVASFDEGAKGSLRMT